MWRRPTSCRWSTSPTLTVTSTWTVCRWLRRTLGRGRIPSSLRSSTLSKSATYQPTYYPSNLLTRTLNTLRCSLPVYRITKCIISVFSVTYRVRSTDSKSASATKQKRTKKVTSVRTSGYFKSSRVWKTLHVSSVMFHHSHLFLSSSRTHQSLSLSVFMRCQLNRLQKGQMIDEWFPLSSHVPLKGIEPGSLRVRARYSMEKIMPEEEYSEFKEVWFIVKWFWLQCPLTRVHLKGQWRHCCVSFADDLAERVSCHLCSGPCMWSGPHLTGKSSSADL